MGSDLDDDEALHSSSFLTPHMLATPTVASPTALTVESAVPLSGADAREQTADVVMSVPTPSVPQGKEQANDDDDDDDDDEDERPRAVPRERVVASVNPFAAPSMAPSMAPRMAPFATPHPHQQQVPTSNPQQQLASTMPAPSSVVAPPVDEYLRVSSKCTARHCFRVQWEAEMNPRCREKTALNVDGKIYLFDGFYILCHDDTPDVPQFEYTRSGVMCRIRFIRETLPQALLPPKDPNHPAISSPQGCHTLLELTRYLFQALLGIQSMHLFQTVFADPSRATGDVDDYCSDFHLIPRFISVTEAPLLNKDDLLAPHRIGFAVGKFLSIDHVLGCLAASTRFDVATFLQTNSPRSMVDSIVSTRIRGVPGLFRVDGLVCAPPPESNNNGEAPAATPVAPMPQLQQLRHVGQGAIEYDGVDSKKKLRKWYELGQLVQVSPRVDTHMELLNPAECNLTGLRTDVFEVASAMPMVLKYIRHYKLLASFEADMKLQFKDKTLLRQAFTHGSYVDAAMQSVNTVEATISRVRLGHVFENTASLKRDRSAFLGEQTASRTDSKTMNAEVKRVTEKHLTTDFKPEFHSKFLCPYERLEFLGDAVLSFLVATSSFLKLPHSAGEGVLHNTRKDITNNAALGRVARDANFSVLMLTAYDLTKLKEEVVSKIAADCMEALLGAVYTDQGIDACRRLLLELMDRHDPNVRELFLLDADEVIEKAAAYTEIDRVRFKQWEQEREMRLTHRRFTTTTNVVIRNTHLWLQAVTHGSFKAPQIDDGEFLCTDPSYERIEFLGDAVLQLLSSEFLVDALPNYQEHLLTQARSSLVKNTRLAVVARDAGYEEFIRLGNLVKQNGNLYTEDVLADVFEATLGAVFLENPRDLNKVRSILQQTLFPLLTEAIRRREWMNPEKVLAHYIAEWSRGASRRIDCMFKKLPGQLGNEHGVAVHINGFRVAHASGRTIQEAKNRACKQALYLYGIGLGK